MYMTVEDVGRHTTLVPPAHALLYTEVYVLVLSRKQRRPLYLSYTVGS